MRYYQLAGQGHVRRFVVETDEGVFDLTSAHPGLTGFGELAHAASVAGASMVELTRRQIDSADTVPRGALVEDRLLPLVPEEVWAAGVTYEISEEARKSESSMAEVYIDVYDADRPEIFFKATPSRTVGPEEAVGVRRDSDWNVPEPELAVVLYRGEIVGYTVGNDVSSRAIEGRNPLYLPQAKIYDRCCSIGPCVVPAESIADPHDLRMSMEIARDGETLFSESTSTAEMVRTDEELVHYFTSHNAVPELAVLMTGTSLVPPQDFTLTEGDVVSIDIEGIGTLVNPVVEV
ncbi:fumarylacetoacetate hydrolase family protein [Halogeometricum luteum]|uniref:Fumarylacetoacetate hydrolase family protein n=1 Tax=Halogeometricum luteum TaxID=2950537 RepID=A0ABU2G3W8_9EURY|nr:fumarylacetoacetate hydrolase family protein [Halogeometricum sp. S3BR5-2]MDS0294973.1 fumarylacetoacetate hydrolase family protein [Halogeometricum sp. S3BR5-2]